MSFPRSHDSRLKGININDLPVEIFHEIFLHYIRLPSLPSWTRPTVCCSMKTFSTPMPLTHVCGRWRDIACTFADLWTSIFVLGPTRDFIPLVEIWLERADHFPIAIEFVEKSFGRSDKETAETSCDLINRVFWKWLFLWEHIDFEFSSDIEGNGGEGMHDIRANVDLDYPPELRSVRLIDRDFWDPQLSAWLWSRVVYNPHVTKLEARNMPVGPMHKGITEFTCHKPLLVDDLFGLLSSWPKLEKVSVKIKGGEGGLDYTLPDVHITLDKLYYISALKNPGIRASLLPILNHFTCPRLQHIDMSPDEGIDQRYNEGLYRFIERSGCQLRTLKGVVLVGMPEESIARFFTLPQLRHLVDLKVIWGVSYFFKLLTSSPHTTPMLSNLESLDVHYVYNRRGWELSELLLSRFKSLKKINLTSTDRCGWVPLSDRLWYHPNMMLTTLADAIPGVPERILSRTSIGSRRVGERRLLAKQGIDLDMWMARPVGIRHLNIDY